MTRDAMLPQGFDLRQRQQTLETALTGLLALTPAGAPVVYVPACAWLVLQGRVVAGVLLLGWGIVTVSTVDNMIRS